MGAGDGDFSVTQRPHCGSGVAAAGTPQLLAATGEPITQDDTIRTRALCADA